MTNTASEEFGRLRLGLEPKLDDLDKPLQERRSEGTLSLIIFGGGPSRWRAKIPTQALCKVTWSNGRWTILWDKREVIYDEAEEPTAETLDELAVVKSNVDPPDLVQKILAVVKKEKAFVIEETQSRDSNRAPLCPRP